MSDRVLVYGLVSTADDASVRYVGITGMTLAERLKCHLSRARCGEQTFKAKWVRSVFARGQKVQIVLLREATTDDCYGWERHYIATLPNLTNGTAGGEGLPSPTPETRAKMRAAHLGKKQSPETIEKRRAQMLGNKIMVGRKLSAETRAKLSAMRQGKTRTLKWTAEGIENIRSAALGNTNRLGIAHTQETKDKIRLAQLGKKRGPHKPETIEKMRAARAGQSFSAETRQKMSDAAKRRHARQRGEA